MEADSPQFKLIIPYFGLFSLHVSEQNAAAVVYPALAWRSACAHRVQRITDRRDSTTKFRCVRTSFSPQSLKQHFAHVMSKNGKLEPVRITEMNWRPVADIFIIK